MRARNLTKPCRGRIANPRALSRLTQGKHPYDEKDLATAPRRMTVDDVGYAPKERDTWSEGSVTGCERDTTPTPPEQCTGQNNCTDAHPEPSSDEDVFDFGKGFDEA